MSGCSPQQRAPQNGVVLVNGAANNNLNGTGAISTLIIGDTVFNHGTYVTSITIKSTVPPTVEGMIRLFIKVPPGATFLLINEIPVPAATSGAAVIGTTSPTFGTTVYFNSLFLAPGTILGVSSQTADSYVISASAEMIVGYMA